MFRLMERSQKYGLSYFEAEYRVFDTVETGRISKRHTAFKGKTYCKYYKDNMSFFVITKMQSDFLIVKTVIIQKGR